MRTDPAAGTATRTLRDSARDSSKGDPAGWTALGSRHDRTDMYGEKPLEKLLRHVDANIMLLALPCGEGR